MYELISNKMNNRKSMRVTYEPRFVSHDKKKLF